MNIKISGQLQRILIEHITHSGNGIAVLDAQDRFIYHNDAFVRTFNLECYSVLGHTFDEMLVWMHAEGIGLNTHSVNIDEWLAFVRSEYRSKDFRTFEVSLLDGRWVLMTEQLNSGGEVVLVSNDITHSKMTERALRNAQKKLEKLALTDELTGLPNRRSFMSNLSCEHQRSLRYHHPVSLVVIDLDYFKKINDQYGHASGDYVLCHFSYLLRRNLRKEDMLGRIGGEEFAVLLPETTKQDALILLERIQKAVASSTIDNIAPGFKYTFSAGLTELVLDAPPNCQEWLHTTDLALYQAKSSGRNRLCVGAEPDHPPK